MSVGQNLGIEILSRTEQKHGSQLKAKIIRVPAYNDILIRRLEGQEFELTVAFKLASLPKTDTLDCDQITFDTSLGQIARPLTGLLSALDVSGIDVRVTESRLLDTGTSLHGEIINVPYYKSLLAKHLKGQTIGVTSHKSPNHFRVGSLVTFPSLTLSNLRNSSTWQGHEKGPSEGRILTAKEKAIWQAVVDFARSGPSVVPSADEQKTQAILGAPVPQ